MEQNMLMRWVMTGVVLLFLDFIYLYSASGFFQSMIQSIQCGKKMEIRIIGAVITYICLIALLNVFIFNSNRGVKDAFLLGICVYGVYETTNYAIIDKWLKTSVVVDTLWGGILFGLTTYIMKKIY
jgi:uncharacterized membrane protein